ncbi:hypothetical protein [Succinivibrio faecicola]|uniref:NAD(P)-dependent oxidoreductase n=1 Tax=Succinivibrio faecicola TaxID=2820300 RepID=A0ABS7DI88_9GAMM|nr:hypothetical protein [Succinivibrio faecicola]MBW7571012.1 NAD(P)-dependent oxidoreductase [Succinivibrio faecicola]
MTSALIGSTGFVGNTLLSQRSFDNCYHSTDIGEIDNKEFDLVICAAAPAKKWYANLHPDEDRACIDSLIGHLKTIKAKKFILISTVDVFKSPVNVDENSPISLNELQPYGYNRRRLELFVQENFKVHLIVRLPGLVGTGLKKNIIFDFKNKNEIEKIESDNVFQFYPMKNLLKDITTADKHGLKLIHLTAAPVSVKEVAKIAFNFDFDNHIGKPLVSYDFKSVHAALFGPNHDYQYDKTESLKAIREYAEE